MYGNLGSWFYVPRPSEVDDAAVLRAQLTLKQRQLGKDYTFSEGRTPLQLTEVRDDRADELGLPRAWALHEGVEIGRDERAMGQLVDIRFTATLRPEQEPIVRNAIAQLQAETGPAALGGILEAVTGKGKTVMLLALAAALGRTTLVVVHTRPLVDQWVRAILEHTSVPIDRIGYAYQKKHDDEGKDIVIGLVQSIAKDQYPESWKRYFGTVILDECDLYPTRTFHTACAMFPAFIRLAATATLNRKDGLSKLLDWHVGPVVGKLMRPDVIPDVYVVQSELPVNQRRFTFPVPHDPAEPAPPPRISYTMMMQTLELQLDRNDLVLAQVHRAYQAGRKSLVLSHRREHLVMLRNRFHQRYGIADEETGLFMGGRKKAELEAAQRSRVIWGTYKMMGRGVDVPEIDAVFLALPIADPRQAVGRAMRGHAGKRTPVVVDVVDMKVPTLRKLYRGRARWYREVGCGGRWPRKLEDDARTGT